MEVPVNGVKSHQRQGEIFLLRGGAAFCRIRRVVAESGREARSPKATRAWRDVKTGMYFGFAPCSYRRHSSCARRSGSRARLGFALLEKAVYFLLDRRDAAHKLKAVEGTVPHAVDENKELFAQTQKRPAYLFSRNLFAQGLEVPDEMRPAYLV